MENTIIKRTGDGETRVFSLPFPYLRREHIKVTVDAVSVGFTFSSAATVSLAVPPLTGAEIVIQRITPTTPLVDFASGGTLTEEDLDTANLQSLYLAEEADYRMSTLELEPSAAELPDISFLPATYAEALGEAPDSGSSEGDYDFLGAYQGT